MSVSWSDWPSMGLLCMSFCWSPNLFALLAFLSRASYKEEQHYQTLWQFNSIYNYAFMAADISKWFQVEQEHSWQVYKVCVKSKVSNSHATITATTCTSCHSTYTAHVQCQFIYHYRTMNSIQLSIPFKILYSITWA